VRKRTLLMLTRRPLHATLCTASTVSHVYQIYTAPLDLYSAHFVQKNPEGLIQIAPQEA